MVGLASALLRKLWLVWNSLMVTFASTASSCNILEFTFFYPTTSWKYSLHSNSSSSSVGKEIWRLLGTPLTRSLKHTLSWGQRIPAVVWLGGGASTWAQEGPSAAVRHHLRALCKYCNWDIKTAASPSFPGSWSHLMSFQQRCPNKTS